MNFDSNKHGCFFNYVNNFTELEFYLFHNQNDFQNFDFQKHHIDIFKDLLKFKKISTEYGTEEQYENQFESLFSNKKDFWTWFGELSKAVLDEILDGFKILKSGAVNVFEYILNFIIEKIKAIPSSSIMLSNEFLERSCSIPQILEDLLKYTYSKIGILKDLIKRILLILKSLPVYVLESWDNIYFGNNIVIDLSLFDLENQDDEVSLVDKKNVSNSNLQTSTTEKSFLNTEDLSLKFPISKEESDVLSKRIEDYLFPGSSEQKTNIGSPFDNNDENSINQKWNLLLDHFFDLSKLSSDLLSKFKNMIITMVESLKKVMNLIKDKIIICILTIINYTSKVFIKLYDTIVLNSIYYSRTIKFYSEFVFYKINRLITEFFQYSEEKLYLSNLLNILLQTLKYFMLGLVNIWKMSVIAKISISEKFLQFYENYLKLQNPDLKNKENFSPIDYLFEYMLNADVNDLIKINNIVLVDQNLKQYSFIFENINVWKNNFSYLQEDSQFISEVFVNSNENIIFKTLEKFTDLLFFYNNFNVSDSPENLGIIEWSFEKIIEYFTSLKNFSINAGGTTLSFFQKKKFIRDIVENLKSSGKTILDLIMKSFSWILKIVSCTFNIVVFYNYTYYTIIFHIILKAFLIPLKNVIDISNSKYINKLNMKTDLIYQKYQEMINSIELKSKFKELKESIYFADFKKAFYKIKSTSPRDYHTNLNLEEFVEFYNYKYIPETDNEMYFIFNIDKLKNKDLIENVNKLNKLYNILYEIIYYINKENEQKVKNQYFGKNIFGNQNLLEIKKISTKNTPNQYEQDIKFLNEQQKINNIKEKESLARISGTINRIKGNQMIIINDFVKFKEKYNTLTDLIASKCKTFFQSYNINLNDIEKVTVDLFFKNENEVFRFYEITQDHLNKNNYFSNSINEINKGIDNNFRIYTNRQTNRSTKNNVNYNLSNEELKKKYNEFQISATTLKNEIYIKTNELEYILTKIIIKQENLTKNYLELINQMTHILTFGNLYLKPSSEYVLNEWKLDSKFQIGNIGEFMNELVGDLNNITKYLYFISYLIYKERTLIYDFIICFNGYERNLVSTIISTIAGTGKLTPFFYLSQLIKQSNTFKNHMLYNYGSESVSLKHVFSTVLYYFGFDVYSNKIQNIKANLNDSNQNQNQDIKELSLEEKNIIFDKINIYQNIYLEKGSVLESGVILSFTKNIKRFSFFEIFSKIIGTTTYIYDSTNFHPFIDIIDKLLKKSSFLYQFIEGIVFNLNSPELSNEVRNLDYLDVLRFDQNTSTLFFSIQSDSNKNLFEFLSKMFQKLTNLFIIEDKSRIQLDMDEINENGTLYISKLLKHILLDIIETDVAFSYVNQVFIENFISFEIFKFSNLLSKKTINLDLSSEFIQKNFIYYLINDPEKGQDNYMYLMMSCFISIINFYNQIVFYFSEIPNKYSNTYDIKNLFQEEIQFDQLQNISYKMFSGEVFKSDKNIDSLLKKVYFNNPQIFSENNIFRFIIDRNFNSNNNFYLPILPLYDVVSSINSYINMSFRNVDLFFSIGPAFSSSIEFSYNLDLDEFFNQKKNLISSAIGSSLDFLLNVPVISGLIKMLVWMFDGIAQLDQIILYSFIISITVNSLIHLIMNSNIYKKSFVNFLNVFNLLNLETEIQRILGEASSLNHNTIDFSSALSIRNNIDFKNVINIAGGVGSFLTNIVSHMGFFFANIIYFITKWVLYFIIHVIAFVANGKWVNIFWTIIATITILSLVKAIKANIVGMFLETLGENLNATEVQQSFIQEFLNVFKKFKIWDEEQIYSKVDDAEQCFNFVFNGDLSANTFKHITDAIFDIFYIKDEHDLEKIRNFETDNYYPNKINMIMKIISSIQNKTKSYYKIEDFSSISISNTILGKNFQNSLNLEILNNEDILQKLEYSIIPLKQSDSLNTLKLFFNDQISKIISSNKNPIGIGRFIQSSFDQKKVPEIIENSLDFFDNSKNGIPMNYDMLMNFTKKQGIKILTIYDEKLFNFKSKLNENEKFMLHLLNMIEYNILNYKDNNSQDILVQIESLQNEIIGIDLILFIKSMKENQKNFRLFKKTEFFFTIILIFLFYTKDVINYNEPENDPILSYLKNRNQKFNGKENDYSNFIKVFGDKLKNSLNNNFQKNNEDMEEFII